MPYKRRDAPRSLPRLHRLWLRDQAASPGAEAQSSVRKSRLWGLGSRIWILGFGEARDPAVWGLGCFTQNMRDPHVNYN